MSASGPLIEYMCVAVRGLPELVAIEEMSRLLDQLSNVELAALLYDWEHFWARPNQLPPAGSWRSWGFLTGRGFGKTLSVAQYVNAEVRAGRAMRIALIAQDEDSTIDIQVRGVTGLIETSPPWFKAQFERDRVLWPNGAEAYVFSPVAPGKIRGPGFHLSWATELQSWPASTMSEAWSNLQLVTRLGYARTVWDCTPKRRHPLIKALLARAARDPERHYIVRGSTWDNAANLAEGVVADYARDMTGQRAKEELEGHFSDEDAEALWKQDEIDRFRREMPTSPRRRAIAVDPAVTNAEGSDATGIAEGSLDGETVVIERDLSDHYAWDDWGQLVVRRYFEIKSSCVVVETNRGGSACTANIRAAAKELALQLARPITVKVVPLDAEVRHERHTIYVKEINSQQSKAGRAEPVAAMAKRGGVAHAAGTGLELLEEELTTWTPPDPSLPRSAQAPSPNRLDAAVHLVWELAGLWKNRADGRAGFVGIGAASDALSKRTKEEGYSQISAMASALRRSNWSGGGRL